MTGDMKIACTGTFDNKKCCDILYARKPMHYL